MPILRFFLPHASTETLDLLHHIIRKCAHFTEYFILSLLILRGIRAGAKGMRLRWALIAILLVAGYASLDEFHQSFVPGRTAAVGDVLIDTSGGAVALIVASLFARFRKRPRSSSARRKHRGRSSPDQHSLDKLPLRMEMQMIRRFLRYAVPLASVCLLAFSAAASGANPRQLRIEVRAPQLSLAGCHHARRLSLRRFRGFRHPGLGARLLLHRKLCRQRAAIPRARGKTARNFHGARRTARPGALTSPAPNPSPSNIRFTRTRCRTISRNTTSATHSSAGLRCGCTSLAAKDRPIELSDCGPQRLERCHRHGPHFRHDISGARITMVRRCPLEISDFAEKDFEVLGTKYHVIVHDVMGQKDFTKFVDDLQKVVAQMVPMFQPVAGTSGQAAPFKDYYFIYHVWPKTGGGLEHLNSTQINFSADWDSTEPVPGYHKSLRSEALRFRARILPCLERQAPAPASPRPLRLFANGAHTVAVDLGRPHKLLRRACLGACAG